MAKKLGEQYGRWVFLTPIGGLRLTEAVDLEFRVERVNFVSASKMPRIRQRLGLPERISVLRERNAWVAHYFSRAQTFATFRDSGKPADMLGGCARIVEEELAILALSQLGFKKRRRASQPHLLDGKTGRGLAYIFVDSQRPRHTYGGALTQAPFEALQLDRWWLNFQERVFFFRLLDILRGRRKVATDWRELLRRAAILAGQSFTSTRVPSAFLKNMIVLEMILTEQGDKYAQALPHRMEAFLGWAGYWKQGRFSARIKEVYQRRCEYVHDGNSSNITNQDLLFTDDLVLNILNNIVRHPKIFYTKQAVVDFADRVACEKKLGVKPRVAPKTLQILQPNYTAKDLREI